jgi:hypothetical protein
VCWLGCNVSAFAATRNIAHAQKNSQPLNVQQIAATPITLITGVTGCQFPFFVPAHERIRESRLQSWE